MKKVLSLVLAVVLAFGMATVAFAANSKITGIDETLDAANGLFVSITGSTAPTTANPAGTPFVLAGMDDDYSNFVPGNKKIVYLNPAVFTVESGAPYTATTTGLPLSDVEKGKVKVRLDANSASKKVIEKVSLKQYKLNTGAGGTDPKNFTAIELEFKDPYVAVSNVDFDIDLVITLNGTKQATYHMEGKFELEFDKDIDADQEEIILGPNRVAQPDTLVRGIVVDTDENVKATINMASNKKYYFAAYNEIRDEDLDLIDKYSQIEMIYYIDQVNMKFAGNYIEIDEADTYHVYNDEGIYIGTTAEKLPFSTKYYLATEKIAIAEPEPTEPEPTEPEPTEPAPTEPAPGASNGTNNPDTGVNGFVNVAVVAGVVSLAAAAAVSMKKK